MNVVSLFDGISCGRVALEQLNSIVNKYVAFETDKFPRSISRYNFPDIIHKGDVLEANYKDYQDFDLIIGGSPCTFWSIAKTNREIDKEGIGWKLFMCFIKALAIIQPRYFLYENVV